MFALVLIIFDVICLCAALYFMIESLREKEHRAPYFGLAGSIFHLILIPLIIWVFFLKVPIAILFCVYVLFFSLCLIPGAPNPKALKGSTGYKVGDVKRFDERYEYLPFQQTGSPHSPVGSLDCGQITRGQNGFPIYR